jgi:tight adherence protein B
MTRPALRPVLLLAALPLVLLPALLSGVALAGPAAAAGPALEVGEVVAGGSQVQLKLTGRDLPAGVEPDPATVDVQAVGPGGEVPVPASASRYATTVQGAPPPQQTVMLVIDTSGSMDLRGNGRLDAAKQAARQYLTGLPGSVRVGLVTFGDEARVVQAPTTPDVVAGAVGSLEADGDTALYQAVVVASQQLSRLPGTRDVLLLTDGANTQDSATEADAVGAVRTARIKLSAISFGSKRSEQNQLRQLVTRAGGREPAVADDAEELSRQFRSEARSTSSAVLVRLEAPAQLQGRTVTLRLSVRAGGTVLRQTATVPFPAAPAPSPSPTATALPALRPAPAPGPVSGSNPVVLAIALGCLFVAVGTVAALALGAATSGLTPAARTRRRLAIYSIRGGTPQPLLVQEEPSGPLGGNFLTRSAVKLADRVAGGGSLRAGLERRLEQAAVPLKAAEWLVLHASAVVAAGVLVFLLTGGKVAGAAIGLLLGLIGPWLALTVRKDRREQAFLNQLPETLLMMAGSLRAGYSTPQAIDTVVREAQPPISSELNRALVEARLGADVEDALEGVAERMASRDFAWVVMAIRVQRQVGGNLAELLSTISNTMRERERLRRQVRALSAEGKLSAWILGLLPIVFGLYMALVRPEYVGVLVTDSRGLAMLAVAALLMLVGALWLRRVVTVKI